MLSILLFSLCTLLQVALWTGILRSALQHPPPGRSATGPPCSVIICARNELPNLRKNLPPVLQQVYGQFEVIVVDDHSSDGSTAWLQAQQGYAPHLRVVTLNEKKHPGKKAALHAGIGQAVFEHLLLTDADCQPASPFWIRDMMAAFASPETQITLGLSPFLPGTSLAARFSGHETLYTGLLYTGLAKTGMPYMGVGRNLAYKKPVYLHSLKNPTHRRLTSGDDDLTINASAHARNTAVCTSPESWQWTTGPATWRQWRRQKQRHLSTGTHYRPKHQAVLAILAASHPGWYALAVAALLAAPAAPVVYVLIAARMASVIPLACRMHKFFYRSADFGQMLINDLLLAIYFGIFVPYILIRNKKLIPWT